MRPADRGASGREWGQPDRIAESTDDTDSLDDRGAVSKQGDDLHLIAKRINEATTAADFHARSAVKHAMAAGALLIQAKALLAHGEWLPWVERNCTIAARTASAYIRLATKVPELPDAERQRVADLPLREAVRAIGTGPETPTRARSVSYSRRDDTLRAVETIKRASKVLLDAARDLKHRNGLKPQRVESLRTHVRNILAMLDAEVPR